METRIGLLVVLATGTFHVESSAQPQWSDHTAHPRRMRWVDIAYDEHRTRLVAVGWSDFWRRTHGTSGPAWTWEWDGEMWRRMPHAERIPPREKFRVVYDAARRRVVLFGGVDDARRYLDDTWTWDGTRWDRHTPAVSPPARAGHGMAWDPVRRVVVLFGGRGDGGKYGDTWTWDGSQWTAKSPPRSPLPREEPIMGWDGSLNRVVLIGGLGALPFPEGDIWWWTGSQWVGPQIGPATFLMGAGLTWDAHRGIAVMLGGKTLGSSDDVWEGQGTNWTRVVNDSRRVPFSTAAYDSLRKKVLGLLNMVRPSLISWDGGTLDYVASGHLLAAPSGAAIASVPSSGTVVMFGGTLAAGESSSETWLWRGAATGWQRATPLRSPPPRRDAAVTPLPNGEGLLLFGGAAGAQDLRDTWIWDGSNWEDHTTLPAPAPRAGALLATDTRRGVVVLYGGFVGSWNLNDLWEWDGVTWRQYHSGVMPPAATRPGSRSLAFDPSLGVTVLRQVSEPLTTSTTIETWTWDGNVWRRLAAQEGTATGYGDMAWDPVRSRFTHVGRTEDDRFVSFDFVDGRWVEGRALQAQYGAARVAWSEHDAALLVFGQDGTYLLGADPPGTVAPLGPGCPGTAGVPSLSAQGRPWLGERFDLRVGSLPADAPAFGILGFDKTRFGAFALPLDLSFLGMTGCLLHTSIDASYVLAVTGGIAGWTLSIPPDPSSVGASFHAQVAVGDAPANPLGVVLSDALTMTIGVR